MQFNDKFLKAIPKTDLHLHLDGSLRLNTLIDLAKIDKIKLPSYTEEGLKEKVFKKKYNSLVEYLKGFAYTCAVLQNKESLERTAYELAWDNFNEGVRYIEIRFAPQLHINKNQTFEEVMYAIDNGLKKAKKEINSKIKGDEPLFEYGIIVCAMRFFNRHFSQFYSDIFNLHKFSSEKDIIKTASF
jgi:adenosine deaminase